jgi:hypothetical protein
LAVQTKVEVELRSIRDNVQILMDALCPATDTKASTKSESGDETTASESADDDASATPAVQKSAAVLQPGAGSVQRDLHASIAASVRPPARSHFRFLNLPTLPTA